MKLTAIFLLVFAISGQGQPATQFYPDGYYLSSKEFRCGEWNFGWLSVRITPAKDFKKSVSVRFVNAKTGKWIDAEAAHYFITHDSTAIAINSKQVGRFTINGHFTRTNPPHSDKGITNETIVFTGRYTFNNKSLPIEFTWTEGD